MILSSIIPLFIRGFESHTLKRVFILLEEEEEEEGGEGHFVLEDVINSQNCLFCPNRCPSNRKLFVAK